MPRSHYSKSRTATACNWVILKMFVTSPHGLRRVALSLRLVAWVADESLVASCAPVRTGALATRNTLQLVAVCSPMCCNNAAIYCAYRRTFPTRSASKLATIRQTATVSYCAAPCYVQRRCTANIRQRAQYGEHLLPP